MQYNLKKIFFKYIKPFKELNNFYNKDKLTNNLVVAIPYGNTENRANVEV